MALDVLNVAAPQADESLIEVGCGSGALLRRIARRTGVSNVAGLDINPFLLREARALAAAEDVAERIVFHEGSGEAIPLPDDTFDITFSSTMLEEADAERVLGEMVRITKPGGRVIVIVRAVDLRGWTNLPLPEALLTSVLRSGGLVSEKGCADQSLYRRFRDAGLKQVCGGPAWSWVSTGDPYWKYREAQARNGLTAAESEAWSDALASARAEGLPILMASPYHCALGVT